MYVNIFLIYITLFDFIIVYLFIFVLILGILEQNNKKESNLKAEKTK